MRHVRGSMGPIKSISNLLNDSNVVKKTIGSSSLWQGFLIHWHMSYILEYFLSSKKSDIQQSLARITFPAMALPVLFPPLIASHASYKMSSHSFSKAHLCKMPLAHSLYSCLKIN